MICTGKAMQGSQEHTSIEINGKTNTRKDNIEKKLYLGCIRHRWERSQCDFEWEQN